MADKRTTTVVAADLSGKEVDLFVDQLAELLLKQVEEAEVDTIKSNTTEAYDE